MAWYTSEDVKVPVFSPIDAGLAGFRFIARRPDVVAIWTGIFLLYEIGVSLVFLALPKDMAAAIQAVGDSDQSPDLALSMAPAVSTALLIYSVSLLAFTAVMFTAAYRAMLLPSEKSIGYIRLGADEFYMGCLIFLMAALIAGYFVLLAIFISLIGLLGSGFRGVLEFLYLFALLAVVIAAIIYPSVRLSLTMPMTLVDKHVRVIESWKHTRGAFWQLFLAYVVAAFMIFLVFISQLVILALIAIVALVGTRGSFSVSSLFHPDTSTLSALLTPATFVAALLSAIASAVFMALLCAPVAEAYRVFGGRALGASPLDPP